MIGRILFRTSIFVVLLIMMVGSNLTSGLQDAGAKQLTDPGVSLGATVPWLLAEVDTDGDTGLHASVAYDPTWGTIYISYYDATNQRLRMARSDGKGQVCGPNGEWGCLTLDSTADVGKYSSIAVNPKTGGIGVAYHDATNGKLKYIYFSEPRLLTYEIYTIDRGITDISKTGLHTSLAYSEEGTPFIAYYFENTAGVDALMFAYYSVASGNCVNGDVADEWRCHTIISGEGMGQYPSLVVKNNPKTNDWDFHISFYNGGTGELWYTKTVESLGNCGSDLTSMICYGVAGGEDVGRYSSLFLDGAGDFHIAYYNATTKKLMYAVELASGVGNCGLLGSAQCEEIDSMQANYHPLGVSIAQDPAGHPAIAYQAADGSLKLARPLTAIDLPAGAGNCGPENPFYLWFCETIDPHGTWVYYRNGDFVSLNISPIGVAQIAYNGFITGDGGNLMVAYQQPEIQFLPLVLRNH